MKQYAEKQKRTLILSILTFLLLSAGVFAVGYGSYRDFEAQTADAAEKRVLNEIGAKIKGLADFHEEIADDVDYIYKNTAFSDLVALYLKDPQDAESQENILTWMKAYQADDQFDGIYLLNAQGAQILSVSGEVFPPAVIEENIPEALRSGEVTFIDFYRSESDQRVYLALLAPILDGEKHRQVIGFLVLRMNPRDYLYPYINGQTMDGAAVESFLVRRDGNDVLFLSDSGPQMDTALTLRIPLDKMEDLAVKAAVGQTGLMQGVDYRGIKVIGAAQSVPDFPWLLIARMDAAEVYTPVKEYLWRTVMLMGAVILCFGMGLVLFLRQQDLHFYRAKVDAAEKLRESEELFRSAFQNSAIGMALISLEGKWLRVNTRLCMMLGYSEGELLTGTFQDITNPEDLAADMDHINELLDGRIESYMLEKRYAHKNGGVVWVLLAKALIRDRAGVPLYFIAQIEDISERRRTEEQLRLLTRELDVQVRMRTRELQKVNQTLIQEKQRAEMLADFSATLIEYTNDYGGLLQKISDGITALIGDGCIIAFASSDQVHLRAEFVSHRDPRIAQKVRELILNKAYSLKTAKLSTLLIQSKKSFSSEALSYAQAYTILPPELLPLLKKEGSTGIAGIPLIGREQTLGAIFVIRNDAGAVPFNDDEVAYLRSIASPLALSIENAKLFEDVKENREQLRGLSRKMVDLQEKQIKDLARELHDGVGQNLTTININLSLLKQLLGENYSDGIKARLVDTSQITEETIVRMRNVMAEFLPPMLERYGLSPALLWYGDQFTKRTNIAVSVNDYSLNAARLSFQAEVGLFRIVQEALNNIAKYAHATQVNVEIKDNGNDVFVMVADNGVGFDPEVVFAEPAHWGFAIMKERARALDASFEIRSARGKGTKVLLRIAR
jgi:PAS domain S-box-containing protein